MKRAILCIAMCGVLLAAFTACSNELSVIQNEENVEVTTEIAETVESAAGEEGENEGLAGLANPVVEYDSLEEINDEIGICLVHPGVMGVTDESFAVISGEIAQYKYTLAGYEYCARGSKNQLEDISGIYMNGATAFEGNTEDFAYAGDSEIKACRFYCGGAQYVVSVTDNGEITEDNFRDNCEEIRNTMVSLLTGEEYSALVGEYQDEYSQRATASVKLFDKDLLEIDIQWSSSAFEYEEWFIRGKIENGRVCYGEDDITHTKYIFSDDTASSHGTEITDDRREGYFEIDNGKLKWTGAGDDSLTQCVFAKAEY